MILLDPAARPVVGHRGAAGECPENTLRSFDRALAQGADALEMDLRATADGVPVVIHDPTVDRTTDGTGRVAALSLAALRDLDAGGGERVPPLAEVLERYPETPLLMEFKEVGVAAPAVETIRRHGAGGRVLVGSFGRAAGRPADRAGIARVAARWEGARFWLGARLGGSTGPTRFRGFAVPEWYHGLHVVDRRFVRRAAAAGLPVHVWTVDRPEDARRLRAWGVAGIITNFPGRMRHITS